MKTRGINHLAMVTNDMEKTVRFYRDIMGFSQVAARGFGIDRQSHRKGARPLQQIRLRRHKSSARFAGRDGQGASGRIQ